MTDPTDYSPPPAYAYLDPFPELKKVFVFIDEAWCDGKITKAEHSGYHQHIRDRMREAGILRGRGVWDPSERPVMKQIAYALERRMEARDPALYREFRTLPPGELVPQDAATAPPAHAHLDPSPDLKRVVLFLERAWYERKLSHEEYHEYERIVIDRMRAAGVLGVDPAAEPSKKGVMNQIAHALEVRMRTHHPDLSEEFRAARRADGEGPAR